MQALTMDYQLTIPAILRRTQAHFGDKAVVSRRGDGSLLRTCYADILTRAGRLGGALINIGVSRGTRVATLCWNHDRHLEAYFAVPAIGAVLHTLNLRLHPDELAFIASDADDQILLVDESLLSLLEQFRTRAPFRHILVLRETNQALPPGCLD